jgi:hypothetical protein
LFCFLADFAQKGKKGKKVKFESGALKSIGVRIGDFVLDLNRLSLLGAFGKGATAKALQAHTLNEFMSLTPVEWSKVRVIITDLLVESNESLQQNQKYRKHLLVPTVSVTMHLPADIGDYTDFFASMDHAKVVCCFWLFFCCCCCWLLLLLLLLVCHFFFLFYNQNEMNTCLFVCF